MTLYSRIHAFVNEYRRVLLTIFILALAAFLVTFPAYATGYWMTGIVALSMILGIIALSMVFLAGYGGLVSLAQIALAGLAGYTIGIFTVSHSLSGDTLGFRLFDHTLGYTFPASYPLWGAILAALLCSAFFAFLFAVVSVRTQGIYFLMITLALAMLIFNVTIENYSVFGGHGGIGIPPSQEPYVAGISFDPDTNPKAFYYLTLVVSVLLYAGLRYLVRSPFGLAVQGIRDNPRRMRALGYWVDGTRVAAFTLAGVVAGIGGILYVWYYKTINPTYIDLNHTISILIIAVIGGLIYFEGAFVGALVYTFITNFASSWTNRFNTVIGLTFLLIVMFSPNGLIGLLQDVRQLAAGVARLRTRAVPAGQPSSGLVSGSDSAYTKPERPRATGPPNSINSSEGVDRSIEA